MTISDTVFSPDRRYRYTLWRRWGNIDQVEDLLFSTERARDNETHLGTRKQFVQVIGLNPSTADETNDDPTIRRCIQFAKDWGFGALCMTNIFAFRATDPQVMMAEPSPIGVQNDFWLSEVAEHADLIICAWGVHGVHMDRGTNVLKLLSNSTSALKINCLGKTKAGNPKHPLYLTKSTRPIPI